MSNGEVRKVSLQDIQLVSFLAKFVYVVCSAIVVIKLFYLEDIDIQRNILIIN